MTNSAQPSVRVHSLNVKNLKNCVNGEILIHDTQRESQRSADVLGIYGQNGSGKTAIVDAMLLLKYLLLGVPLPERAVDWIYAGMDNEERTMGIVYGFRIENLDEKTVDCWYEVKIQLENDKLCILEESLVGKQVEPIIRTKKSVWFQSAANDADTFEPKGLRDILKKKSAPDALLEARSAKLMARRLGVSYLFSEELTQVLADAAPDERLTRVVSALRRFGSHSLFVIDGIQAGAIYSNVVLPISFKHVTDRIGENVHGTHGAVLLDMRNPITLTLTGFKDFSRLVEEINRLLQAIVPNFRIEIGRIVEMRDENDKPIRRCEVFSKRSGVSIPIRGESNGILRLISLASLFVNVYNQRQSCLVIDELDAGIFEYLLGELVSVIQDGGMGQLIFTSHNLRPLETLDWHSLVFTTTNPRKRYERLKGVKPTNNVRDVFLRNVVRGAPGDTAFYDPTDRAEIEFALGDAWGGI